MAITRWASARYDGIGKDGKGSLTTQSGVLKDQGYSFATRFGDEGGTNPEELIAAAHAGCFTMALSLALANEGVTEGSLETTARVEIDKDGAGFTIGRSDLELAANIPGMDEDKLRRAAEDAKANCPVSKVLDAEMNLTVRVAAAAGA
jgi:osmotically inducible protein OsmC